MADVRRYSQLLAPFVLCVGIMVPITLGLGTSVASATGGPASPGDIATVAGNGDPGNVGDGGPATAAYLSNPRGVVVDGNGDIFVADSSDSRIQEIPATTTTAFGSHTILQAGDIYTIAGSATGTSGDSADGPSDNTLATSALLDYPIGLALDAMGDLYIADAGNNRIEELAATTHAQWGIAMTAGDLYTVAGSDSGTDGTSGDGGAATSALLHNPTGVAIDASGDLLIADQNNNRVQLVASQSCNSSGEASCHFATSSETADDIYTIAGSAASSSGLSPNGTPAASSLLSGPAGIALDADGNLYIADSDNNRVEELAARSGIQFGQSMLSDDLYVLAGGSSGSSDGESGAIGAGNLASASLLDSPQDVTLDATGDLYVSEAGNDVVDEISASTSTQWGIAMNANSLYRVAGTAGSPGSSGDGGPSTSALLDDPVGLFASPVGNLYVADAQNNKVREMTADPAPAAVGNDIARVLGLPGPNGTEGDGGPASEAELTNPYGTVVDHSGNLYVADLSNDRVQEVAATDHTQWGIAMTAGDVYTIAGSSSGSSGASANGTAASSSLLDGPSALAIDAEGDLYIADADNNRIVELAAVTSTQFAIAMTADKIYTIAGSSSGSSGSSPSGTAGTSALLNQPTGIGLDAQGDVFIADSKDNEVQELAATSHTQWAVAMTADDLYVVAGTGTEGHTGDGGVATSAELSGPFAVALDSAGDLVVADAGNNRVQEVPASSGTNFGLAMTADDIYTVAGSADAGVGHSGDGGAGPSALLDFPTSVATDATGDVYIADHGNNRVQELAATSHAQWGQAMSAGDIYSVAGSASGSSGDSGDGDSATAALLDDPNGVSTDQSGDVFISDTENDEIRVLLATSDPLTTCTPGTIRTVLGTDAYGTATDGIEATEGGLNAPRGVVVDAEGNLYVADTSSSRVQEVAAVTHSQFGIAMTAGDVYTIAGSAFDGSGNSGNGGPGTSAFLDAPIGLALDSLGDLYIADEANNEVQELAASTHSQWGISMTGGDLYDVAGSSSGTAGSSGDGGAGTSAKLDGPYSLAFDQAGDLVIADSNNNRVQELAATSHTQFGIAMTADDLYTIAGSASGTSGNTTGVTATSALLNDPYGIALDAEGDLFIADSGNNAVAEVPVSSATFYGVTMSAGKLYDIAGSSSGSSGTSGDGGASTSALLDFPVALVVDPTGDVYLADDSRVQEIANESGDQWGAAMTSGDIYTVAGSASGTAGFSGDGGVAASSLLSDPYGVALDVEGDLFIADTGNDALREALSPSALLANSGPTLDSEMRGGANPSEAGDPQPSRAATDASGTGASVDLATGELIVSANDDAISGRGPSLSLTRTYSSTNASVLGPFGYGWTDDYAMHLTADPNVADAEDVTQENGSVVVFLENASGAYVAASRVQASLLHNTGGTWSFTRTGGDTYGFNSSGELTSITDRNGYVTTLSYSGSELSSVTAPGSLSLSFTWGSCGSASCVTGVSDPGGRSLSYIYDAAGDLTSATTIGAAVTSYTYDAAHRLVSVENPLSSEGFTAAERTTSNTYDDAGRLVSQSDPMGNLTTYAYSLDPAGSGTTTVTDPMGTLFTYRFEAGELMSETDASGTSAAATTTDTYDPTTDEVTSVTDPLGHATLSYYDANGDLLETLDPLGVGSSATYDAQGDELSQTSTLGELTSTTYDSDGDATGSSWSLPGGGTASTSDTYGSSTYPGDVTSSVDANGNTTSASYDADGNATCEVDGAGEVTTSYYGASGSDTMALGEQTASVSAVGNAGTTSCPSDGTDASAPTSSTYATTYDYDSFGSVDETSAPETTGAGGATVTHSTSSTEDALGDELTSTDADGNVTSDTYNPDHELVTEQLPGGNCAATPKTGCLTYTYNADGMQTSVTDANNNTTSYTYDPLGRVLSSTNALEETTSYAYDADGNVLSTTDPDGNVTTETYDAANELTSVAQPGEGTLTYTYDEAGDETSYADGASDTTYDAYNVLGQLTSTTDPLGKTTSFTYDHNGNKQTETDPDGNTTSWTYNGDNEVTGIAYSGGPSPTSSVSETYTPDDLLATMTDASGTSHYTYNANDELSSYENGDGKTLSYTEDGNGNVSTITYPGSHSLSETYNAQGELSSIEDWNDKTTSFSYDGDGNLTAITYGNGVSQADTYNAADQLEESSDTLSGTTLASFSYERDGDGLATSETDVGTPDAGSTTYAYNGLNELTTAGSSSYTYNDADDLTTSPGGDTQGFNADDELCYQDSSTGGGSGSCSSPPSGATTYTYSSVGNRTATTPSSGSATDYAWNDAHQMTSVTTGSATSSYTYDGNGLLQSETTGSGTNELLWSPQVSSSASSTPELLADSTNDYLYGPGTTPVEQINSSTGATSYLLSDDLGSVRAITDSSGTVTGAVTYGPWGNTAATSGTVSTPFGYAGGYTDPATGLLYFRARWYDTSTGQWMSLDPMVMDTESPFAYANNDPVNGCDPSGQATSPSKMSCAELAAAIEVATQTLATKYGALANNPNNLPYGGANNSYLSHIAPYRGLQQRLQQLVAEYESRCGGSGRLPAADLQAARNAISRPVPAYPGGVGSGGAIWAPRPAPAWALAALGAAAGIGIGEILLDAGLLLLF